MNGPKDTCVLVHLAAGVGNIVLATPLLMVLSHAGYTVDLLLDADYSGVDELFEEWAVVRRVFDGRRDRPTLEQYDNLVPAIPPFYWSRFKLSYSGYYNVLRRPPDALFYRNERGYYLEFATALGCDVGAAPFYFLPIWGEAPPKSEAKPLVLAPGCKTGEMAAKRWPYFPQLASRFEDVVVVGTAEDLQQFEGGKANFPRNVRSFIGRLSLRQTAEVIATAGAVVSNDCGLGHIAGAIGVPTCMIFGPTSRSALGSLPPNVIALRRGLHCEPCWFTKRFEACHGSIRCLSEIPVDMIANIVKQLCDKTSH